MTYCIPDNTPETWHKVSFNSKYLLRVHAYIRERKINAKFSGAITYNGSLASFLERSGIKDPYANGSVVSFEREEDCEAFKEWYAQNQTDPLSDGIYICDNSRGN